MAQHWIGEAIMGQNFSREPNNQAANVKYKKKQNAIYRNWIGEPNTKLDRGNHTRV